MKAQLIEGGTEHSLLREFDVPDRCETCGETHLKMVYDTRVPMYDNWGWLCEKCFDEYGCSTGIGKGQKYRRID